MPGEDSGGEAGTDGTFRRDSSYLADGRSLLVSAVTTAWSIAAADADIWG